MTQRERVVSVLRALALFGAAVPCVTGCDRSAGPLTTQDPRARAEPRSTSIAGTSCGESSPGQGASCEGHEIGHTCEWHSAVQCTCAQTAEGPRWSACVVRAVPGPLPPPELAA